MALRELGQGLRSCLIRQLGCRGVCVSRPGQRAASTAIEDIQDLELSPSSVVSAPPDNVVQNFDPAALSRGRRTQLPPSRYGYRPPKYFRGPLHPHQPPRPSDPSSREFVPGPFTLPRLEQTYESTIAPDILTLTYTHFPPGYKPPPKGPRLRAWDPATTPYAKNRPLRPPRGGPLLPLTPPTTFRNVPRLTRITVHTMVKGAVSDSAHLHVASMLMQSISNVRCTAHEARQDVAGWGLRKDKFVSLTADLRGENMWHFLGKCVDVVLPRIKDWKGVKGSSGDSTGNISFGLSPEALALFPEVEVNYDMYPPNMIPGCHVTLHTSATNDKEARLFLTALGIPFHGKLIH